MRKLSLTLGVATARTAQHPASMMKALASATRTCGFYLIICAIVALYLLKPQSYSLAAILSVLQRSLWIQLGQPAERQRHRQRGGFVSSSGVAQPPLRPGGTRGPGNRSPVCMVSGGEGKICGVKLCERGGTRPNFSRYYVDQPPKIRTAGAEWPKPREGRREGREKGKAGGRRAANATSSLSALNALNALNALKHGHHSRALTSGLLSS